MPAPGRSVQHQRRAHRRPDLSRRQVLHSGQSPPLAIPARDRGIHAGRDRPGIRGGEVPAESGREWSPGADRREDPPQRADVIFGQRGAVPLIQTAVVASRVVARSTALRRTLESRRTAGCRSWKINSIAESVPGRARTTWRWYSCTTQRHTVAGPGLGQEQWPTGAADPDMRVQNLESLNSGARSVSGIGRDRIQRLQACLVDR